MGLGFRVRARVDQRVAGARNVISHDYPLSIIIIFIT